MAKKKTRRRRNGIKIPVALLAGFIPYIGQLSSAWSAGGWDSFSKTAPKIVGYDGYTSKWHPKYFVQSGGLAILAGAIVHKLASRLGINRSIANMGIPIIRV